MADPTDKPDPFLEFELFEDEELPSVWLYEEDEEDE
jgi:hypothetical protein